MHFFSFSSIFFHAPGVINCVFYQAEKFSEVDKTRIKKNLFLEKYILRSGKIWRVQIRSQIYSTHAYRFHSNRFFLLKRAVLSFFGAKTTPVENRLEIESAASLKKKKKNWRSVFTHSSCSANSPRTWKDASDEQAPEKNSLLGGKSLTSNDVFFFSKKNTATMYFFFRTSYDQIYP